MHDNLAVPSAGSDLSGTERALLKSEASVKKSVKDTEMLIVNDCE
jgi:hypothetical protein